jgi:hypothetical protein
MLREEEEHRWRGKRERYAYVRREERRREGNEDSEG